jgi:hypothetical protein
VEAVDERSRSGWRDDVVVILDDVVLLWPVALRRF